MRLATLVVAFDSLKDKIHADHAQEQEKEVVSKSKSKPKSTKPAEKQAEEKPLEEKPAEKPAEKDHTAIPKRAKNAMPKKKIDRTSSPREFGTTGGSYHAQPGAVQRPHSSTHSSTHTSYGNNFNSKSISIGNTTTNNNNKRTHDSLNPPLQSPPSGVGRSTSAATAVQAPTTKIRRVLSEQTQKKVAKVETPQKAR
ncbi:hypothetical protein TL16_g02397 [Triparma laevis f. inornata]|uniref:Uncharacterized protein n=1 Tax=Triparma laevis f. inornata TaxID=1714386 RepID=A0A9W7DX89_9STRA|nr:hypothetical protein TL16_g02397 [Triparma laevis f. inornata]